MMYSFNAEKTYEKVNTLGGNFCSLSQHSFSASAVATYTAHSLIQLTVSRYVKKYRGLASIPYLS